MDLTEGVIILAGLCKIKIERSICSFVVGLSKVNFSIYGFTAFDIEFFCFFFWRGGGGGALVFACRVLAHEAQNTWVILIVLGLPLIVMA